MTDACNHDRKVDISGKVSDMCFVSYPDGQSEDGYVPRIAGIGGGDYLDVAICLDCRQVVNFDPADVEQRMAELRDERAEEDDLGSDDYDEDGTEDE